MKLRNKEPIVCTQCEQTYTIKAFRKLETTSDNRKLSVCKSCDFAKGFVFNTDIVYNSKQLDKLLEKHSL
jgi:NAD-dependent SIR2 family protein deacetylase